MAGNGGTLFLLCPSQQNLIYYFAVIFRIQPAIESRSHLSYLKGSKQTATHCASDDYVLGITRHQ